MPMIHSRRRNQHPLILLRDEIFDLTIKLEDAATFSDLDLGINDTNFIATSFILEVDSLRNNSQPIA